MLEKFDKYNVEFTLVWLAVFGPFVVLTDATVFTWYIYPITVLMALIVFKYLLKIHRKIKKKFKRNYPTKSDR